MPRPSYTVRSVRSSSGEMCSLLSMASSRGHGASAEVRVWMTKASGAKAAGPVLARFSVYGCSLDPRS